MNDPVLTFAASGDEVDRSREAAEVLGSTPARTFFDEGSWRRLRQALARPPRRGVELVALDGRLFDANVASEGEGITVTLRDVSRYADASSRVAALTAELARRTRDLRMLHEASTELGATTDTHELADLTCRWVARLLDADAVELEMPEATFRYSEVANTSPANGMLPLETALGRVGDLRWWRSSPLQEDEVRLLGIIASRAAVGLEHAVLLDATEARAHRDAMTGLLNRAGALHALVEIDGPFAVALLDVDHFKSINEQYGTEAGDRVLQRLAMVLLQGRFGDVVARWGGEEFLVALPGADLEGAASRMRRVLDRVQESVRAGVQPVTFSCGVAQVGPEGLDRGLADADRALYQAKQEGPGQVRVAS
ncbi:MAG: diguanylate cyclase [Acidimicrobiaceae bacterium]|nr:diguanylate cyclase [Acidimicrobiaceae bacterium]